MNPEFVWKGLFNPSWVIMVYHMEKRWCADCIWATTWDFSATQAFKRALLFLFFLLFPTFLICSYFSLLFHENALLSPLFHSKMSLTGKSPKNFPHSFRSLEFYMLINVFFMEPTAKTSHFLIFTSKGISVQLVLLSQQLSCLLSVKFIISNNSFWWILNMQKPYYPYFFTPKIPTFSLLFQNFYPYFFPTFLLKSTWKPANNVVCATSILSLIRAFASHLNILLLLSYWLNIICSF